MFGDTSSRLAAVLGRQCFVGSERGSDQQLLTAMPKGMLVFAL